MSEREQFADWRARAAAAVNAGQPVPVIGGPVVVGSRVKHMNQRFGYSEGTATVTGFEVEDGDWVKVLVEKAGPGDSLFIGPRWDFDRTELIR